MNIYTHLLVISFVAYSEQIIKVYTHKKKTDLKIRIQQKDHISSILISVVNSHTLFFCLDKV